MRRTDWSTFLTTLKDRNKGSTEKRGLFASHPEMQERLDRITKQIAAQKLSRDGHASTAVCEEHQLHAGGSDEDRDRRSRRGGIDRRRREARRKKPEEKKAEEPKKGRFGLSKLAPTSGGEKKQAQVTASGGARGVDPEKDSKGGPNPALVVGEDRRG